MTQGFFKKMISQIKGIANDSIDAVEDVGRSARQTVRELSADIQSAEEGLVSVQAEYNLMLAKRDTAQRNVDQYLEYAKKAVAQGNTALASEALTDKNKAILVLVSYQKQIDEFHPTLEKLKEHIAVLRERQDAMDRNTSLIVARSAVADAQDRAATIIGDIGNSNSESQTFERLETKVAKQEATAQAKMQMAQDKQNKKPENKYSELDDVVSVTSVQDELAELQRQAGQ